MLATMTATVLPEGNLVVGDERIASSDLGRIDHTNPATGEVQASIVAAGPGEVDRAVQAARTAFAEWRTWHPGERRDVLLRLAATIEAEGERLGLIGSLENGTPIAFGALACAATPADWFRYYAGWVDKIEGRTIPVYPHDAFDFTLHEPYGVVAVLTAFNAPMGFIGLKVAAALAAGNCVVIKPSELAPFTTLAFAELCLQAGLPAGVVNVVTGDGRTGDLLVRHPGVDRITFTGGGATARSVVAAAAENLTPVTLELGGKSANLVFADADLDNAIAMAVQMGVALQSGQGCLLPTRLLVERSVYDEVVEAVVDLSENIAVGDPMDSGTLMGPLISERHCERVLGVIERAKGEGAGRLLTGGERLGGDLAKGYYVAPTVFGDVDNASALAQHEIFGPVLSVIPFDDEAEALAIANATTYGLAGFVFTADLARAHRVIRGLEAGYVSVNGFNFFPPNAPFGGWKQSGHGKEGGLEGLLEMTRVKNAYVLFEA
ncbi:aldehyde dehydrogenase family protein [Sporichthya brevicatena]|uniref:Aldehyde dehydrogenase family protein n=2 Tax=Sporichthya brevicatena TaxID=171442 RepID=A0ABP3RYH2_9ACTN